MRDPPETQHLQQICYTQRCSLIGVLAARARSSDLLLDRAASCELLVRRPALPTPLELLAYEFEANNATNLTLIEQQWVPRPQVHGRGRYKLYTTNQVSGKVHIKVSLKRSM